MPDARKPTWVGRRCIGKRKPGPAGEGSFSFCTEVSGKCVSWCYRAALMFLQEGQLLRAGLPWEARTASPWWRPRNIREIKPWPGSEIKIKDICEEKDRSSLPASYLKLIPHLLFHPRAFQWTTAFERGTLVQIQVSDLPPAQSAVLSILLVSNMVSDT